MTRRQPSGSGFFRALRAVAATNSAALLFANIGVSLIGLITGVVTARALGPAERGDLAVITYWPAILMLLLDFSISDSITLRVSRSRDSLRGATKAGALIACLGCVVGLGGGAAVLPHLLRTDQQHLLTTARTYLLLLIPLSLAGAVSSGALLGLQRFRAVATTRMVATIAYFVAVVLFATLRTPTPELFAWLTLAGIALPAVLNAMLLVTPLIRTVPCASDWQTQIRDGAQLQGTKLASALCGVEDRAIANLTLVRVEIGTYQVASAIGYVMPVIPQAISQLLFARLSVTGSGDRRSMIMASYVRSVTLTGLSAAGAIPLLPFVIPLVYGRAFTSAVIPAIIVVIASVLNSGSQVLQTAARAQLAIAPCIAAELSALVVVALVAWPLTHVIGSSGLAAAYLAGRAVSLGWIAKHSGTLFALRAPDLVPGSKSFRVALANEYALIRSWAGADLTPTAQT